MIVQQVILGLVHILKLSTFASEFCTVVVVQFSFKLKSNIPNNEAMFNSTAIFTHLIFTFCAKTFQKVIFFVLKFGVFIGSIRIVTV